MSTYSKIKYNKLIFYIPCTSSSGNLRGIVQHEEIVDSNKIRLITEGLVYWEEPDKKLVSIEIKPMKESVSTLPDKKRGQAPFILNGSH